MTHSMTAFIREEIQIQNWTATWEIRSINHRYLDIHIFLPEIIRDLEIDLRKKINNTQYINRGRIECKLHIQNNNNDLKNNSITLNVTLIEELIELINKLPNQKKISNIDPIKILSWPGVIIPKKDNIDILYSKLLQSFDNILYKFITIRKKEGQALETTIKKRISQIKNEINNIKKEIPFIIPYQQNKLLQKIKETNINVNNNRLEEELLIYAQKIDISEEIDRIEIHIKNIHHIFFEKIIGKKLDFFMQEIYREINTISSKSTNITITQSGILIKILINQIREQIQNIE